jgi:hypothetical protein
LYEEAAAALEAKDYELALDKWAAIEVKRGSLPYRDRMQIEQRAKTSICARLYNEAFLAVSNQQPYHTLDIWEQIKAIDPDYPDEDGLLELVQRMLDTDAEIKKRDKRLIRGALIVGGLLLLMAIGWKLVNRGNALADGAAATSQAVAAITQTATKRATETAVSTQTAVPPSKTPLPEPTKVAAVIEPTATELPTTAPSATATASPTATATPPPTDTPAPAESPTPTNIGLVLENSSVFDTPNLNGQELTVVAEGDSIVVLGRSEDEKWLFVGMGDLAGFVFRERMQWQGDTDGLPVYTHTDSTDEPTPEAPAASDEITELTFDLWPLAETAVCTTIGWEQDLFFEGHGGNGIYAYYWDGTLIKGPTNSSYIYRLVSPGGAVSSFGRVESGGGLWIQKNLFIDAPNCP